MAICAYDDLLEQTRPSVSSAVTIILCIREAVWFSHCLAQGFLGVTANPTLTSRFHGVWVVAAG